MFPSIGHSRMWPPSRNAYQNLNSNDDVSSPPVPLTDMSQSKSLLTPSIAPSTPYTPYQDSAQHTPRLDYDFPSSPPERKGGWLASGWRGGAKIAFFSTVTLLMINVVLMIYMTTRFPKMNGFPVIYRGTCEQAERQNQYWHLAINVFSTIALGASNYSMQLLSAPNRANIDTAHSSGHWLDIGIPSLRNLRFLSGKRRVAWMLLAVSSLPLHLVYNSTIYAAIATRNYNVLYATEDFAKGGQYNKTAYPDSPSQNVTMMQADAANWQNLSNADCIAQYAHDFVTQYKNLIAVVANTTNHTTPGNTSLLEIVVNELPASNYIGPTYDAFAWICNDTETINKTGVTQVNNAGFVPCSSITPKLEKLAPDWWKTGGFRIQHCLAEKVDADCHLHFSPHLMAPVIFMNIVKAAVIFYVAFRLLDKPIVTLGDAIESFIKHPDPTTQGMCLVSAREIEKIWKSHHAQQYSPQAKPFRRNRSRWFSVVSRGQWMMLFCIFASMFIGLGASTAVGILALAPPTISNAWSLGLGNVRTQNLILKWKLPQLGTNAVLLTAIVANTPQVLFSFLYVVYNTVFTLFHIGEDWDSFGTLSTTLRHKYVFRGQQTATHRSLRVSEPHGQQRMTHFLNLPFRYAIPLLCVSGLLHWLTSQAIFLANISVIPRDGVLPRIDEITTCAYSPQGMLWLIVLGVCMVIFILANGFRRFGGDMMVVGSNSVAISAACHVNVLGGSRQREHLATKKLAWGEIRNGEKPDLDRSDLELRGLGFSPETMRHEDTGYSNDYFDRGRPQGHAREGSDVTGQIAHCTFSDGPVHQPTEGRLYA